MKISIKYCCKEMADALFKHNQYKLKEINGELKIVDEHHDRERQSIYLYVFNHCPFCKAYLGISMTENFERGE